jgi:hypothetical protein
MTFEPATKIADALLYEGYVLYPYRASAEKNRLRWQFGVLVPPAYGVHASEPSSSRTECLLEPFDDCVLHLRIRFLQLQARTLEAADDNGGFRPVEVLDVDDSTLLSWDETVEREHDVSLALADLLDDGDRIVSLEYGAGVETENIETANGRLRGRIRRERWTVTGSLRISAERLHGPYGVVKLRVSLANSSSFEGTTGRRDEALRHSLIATHVLLATTQGTFVSLLDPPEWARPAVESCDNAHTFPVLVGDPARQNLMLSSPIILYDYPEIAPESPTDLFDATEIDEILSLRTMALTEEEKREARATSERAAAIIDSIDSMPPDVLDRLHGAVRYLRESTSGTPPQAATSQSHDEDSSAEIPWWDPGRDASVSPETDSISVDGVKLSRGSLVRLRPGSRRADAQDIFLKDRIATIEAVLFDVDGDQHLAVTLNDDPGADLQQWHGRFLYFSPDEVEPLEETT